jgi:hypothetical protein
VDSVYCAVWKTFLLKKGNKFFLTPLTPELNPSAQRCLPRFFTGDFNFEGFAARRLYKLFGVKGLTFFLPFQLNDLLLQANFNVLKLINRYFHQYFGNLVVLFPSELYIQQNVYTRTLRPHIIVGLGWRSG